MIIILILLYARTSSRGKTNRVARVARFSPQQVCESFKKDIAIIEAVAWVDASS